MYRDRHTKRLEGQRQQGRREKGKPKKCADCNRMFVGFQFLCRHCRQNHDRLVKYWSNPKYRKSEVARCVAYRARKRKEAT